MTKKQATRGSPPQPPKKRRAWPWVVGALAIVGVIADVVNDDDDPRRDGPGYICVNNDPAKACSLPASNDVIAGWCLANGYPDVGIARIAEECKVDYVESHAVRP